MFRATEATIRKLFDSGEYEQFKIPMYQRSYVWSFDELENFLNDFVRPSESSASLKLMGSIIISRSSGENKNFGVVDGQQRLITGSLFLASIRDVWGEVFGYADSDYHDLERYIVRNDRQKGLVLKIEVSENLRQVYESIVVAKVIEEPRQKDQDVKNVLNAYKFFKEQVLNLIEKPGLRDSDKKNLLWGWVDAYFESNIILVTLENEDDAYEVFEGFNARGVDLSIADLFKNLILQKIQGNEEQKVHALEKWNEINTIVKELGISKFNINTFLRYFWIRENKYIIEKELYKRIKKDTSDYQKLLKQLHESALTLKAAFSESTSELEELLSGDSRYAKRIHASLKALKIMNTQSYIVWLMALLEEKNRESISTKWISKSINQVEIFSFRYFGISKLPANKVEKLYSQLSNHLSTAIKSGDIRRVETCVLNEYKNRILEEKLLPEREQFLSDFDDIILQINNKKFVKYILAEIEHFGTSEEKVVDYNAVNIEHLMPQKPSADWKITAVDHKSAVNRLGNLTILHEKINSSMGNKHISEKAKILEKSEIQLNSRILEMIDESEGIWGPLEIATRQSELAIAADKVWSI